MKARVHGRRGRRWAVRPTGGEPRTGLRPGAGAGAAVRRAAMRSPISMLDLAASRCAWARLGGRASPDGQAGWLLEDDKAFSIFKLTYLFKGRLPISKKNSCGENMSSIPDEQYLIDAEGKRKGILLSIERYEQLTEDLHDLAVVAERRNEESIGFDEIKQRLKRDGIV